MCVFLGVVIFLSPTLGTLFKLQYFPSGIKMILELRGGPNPFRDHLDALISTSLSK